MISRELLEIGMDKVTMKKYRIKRTDTRNIAIQQKKGKTWCTISYHGNSLSSLVSGLSDLVTAQHIPEGEELLEQLKTLKLEIVKTVDEIKEIISTSGVR